MITWVLKGLGLAADAAGIGLWTKVIAIAVSILGVFAYHEIQVTRAYYRGDGAGYTRRDTEVIEQTKRLNAELAILTARLAEQEKAAADDRRTAVDEALAALEAAPPVKTACTPVEIERACSLPESVRVKLSKVR
jgi:hypothetical protein